MPKRWEMKVPDPWLRITWWLKPAQIQFILRTADIDEASYEGNKKVLKEWLHQLKLNSLDEKKRMSTSHVIPIVGDQLTVDRLRGLAKYHHDDINGFEQLDWVVPVNGFFHMEMAFVNSLHKQYLGMSGKAEDLSELANKTPEELVLLAEEIYDDYACCMALQKMELRQEKDEVKYQAMMFNADVLAYLDLHEATRTGDVGCIEDLFPILLMCFAGGGNSKYMIEILELLQGLKKEWLLALCDIMCKHCWLVNHTGKCNGFVLMDRVQEHNIKDLKTALTRGDRHSMPEKEKDVAKYAATIVEEKWFVYEEGHKLKKSEDHSKDFVTAGTNVVFEEEAIRHWWKGHTFPRTTQEKWLDEVLQNE
ncbi:hypothetical protein EWM64_g9292 [Hericium alpestre]|uniref:DUF6589 domain-containing protein n=1 Tax=Hericium alpestre TaxID=135208 RepID=A0A4Y9ZKJ3_9AGAM|nr:hypothetical protein EWM64_g9292 [Hericium alpestre]